MQTFRRAIVPLLFVAPCLISCLAAHAVPKPHTVALGAVRKVPYTPPEASADNRSEEATTLRVRPLLVDGVLREWTVGDLHDVTERTFVVRRALHINDALPGESSRWTWQPGSWLQVDRVSGHIIALHLPAFDAQVSNVAWFRDYAAYCGLTTTARGGLVAVVAQLGARKAVAEKLISKGPLPATPHPACELARWQRTPMRATLQPTGGEPLTFDVLGTSSLVEEGDAEQE